MGKTLQVCGLLYDPQSQQILLRQTPAGWMLLEARLARSDDPQEAFRHLVTKLLGIKLPLGDTFPVYDYFDNRLKISRYIFYAQLRSPLPPLPEEFSWFSFKAVGKLVCPLRTKHDTTITQRVISANARALI